MAAKSFRELVAWQRAIELTTALYRLTQQFPREEIYGLTSQLRRLEFPPPATSPKAMDEEPEVNTAAFWESRVARPSRFKHNLSSRGDWASVMSARLHGLRNSLKRRASCSG